MPIKRDMSVFFKQVKSVTDTNARHEKKNYAIEHLFNVTMKDNRAEVIMRFLPPNKDEYKCFVENRIHIKKGFGVDCLEKYGKKCPICEHNHAVYKMYPDRTDPHREELLLPRATSTYYSNVYIVRNDNAPETEGKVFRFRYGRTIMNLIRKAMDGYEDSEEGVHVDGYSPFEWETGSNFILNAVQGPMGPKYDDSKFGKQKPINRYDRQLGKYVPLTVEEQDAIEAKLYTLDDIEKKEEDCRNFDECEKYTRQKLGRGLWKLDENMNPVPSNDAPAVVTSAANKSNAADDFSVNFESSAPATTSVVESSSSDETSFFDDLEKM